ncbi:26S protease regulatory subunit 7 [Capsicum baccatum]|uniref:26S protease regulatory subunit 7 n=1 Tax=Capsicum baccatum TaxID=33114 RepID=A0A2G2VLU6_CAPBA|nr:26S protease regulatory subunit 7 [Capsicum baccatum]
MQDPEKRKFAEELIAYRDTFVPEVYGSFKKDVQGNILVLMATNRIVYLYADFMSGKTLFQNIMIILSPGVNYLISERTRSLVEDYASCLELRSEECQIIKDCREDSGVLILQHQDEEISDDDFEFAGNDVVDLLPKNIDLDVDEDIVNMEAQFEEILQSSATEEHGIKSSLSGVNGLPKVFEALARTLSMPKPKSPIEPPNLQELQRQRKFHQHEGQNRKITLHQPPWSMKELVNPISIASQIHFSMRVDISIVDELMQPLVDEAMLSGYNYREEWIPAMGVLCYGTPSTRKTFLARAVVNHTDACFIRVIGSEPVQKYVSEEARMVRELFQPSVDIKTVLAHMMNRFSNYTALSPEVLPEFFRIEVFAKLNSAIGKSSARGWSFSVFKYHGRCLEKNLQVHPEQVKPLEEYYIKQRKLFDFQVTGGPVETLQNLLVALHLQHRDAVSSAQLTSGC